MGAKEIKRYDTPVCLHIHSLRHRLCDSDGISGKASIDGLVKAGVLSDDSAKEVKSVTYSQELIPRGQEEQTKITIMEAI